MQYRTGTITVTNGSATVTGAGTAFLANVSIGDLIVAIDPAEPIRVAYEVGGVASDTSLTLTAVYGGATQSGLNYVAHRDFHPLGAPLWANGDVEFAAIQNAWNAKSVATADLGSSAFLDTGTSTGQLPPAEDVVLQSQIGTAPSEIPPNSSILAASSDFLTYGGTANAITLTTPYATKRTAYETGMKVRFKATVANTGAATVDVDGLGVKNLKMLDGNDLIAGYIEADKLMDATYDGTNFIVNRDDWYMLGGFGQSWQDVTASRASDIEYTNDTGRPISVSVALNLIEVATLNLFIDDINIDKSSFSGSASASYGPKVSGIVPIGSTYRVTKNAGTILIWHELR